MKLPRILVLPLLLAACSGGGAATSGPAGTTAGGGATTVPATQGTESTDGGAATMAPAATTAGGGGGTASDWCLNTTAEVEAALNVSGITASGSDTPGVGGGCFYTDGTGALVYSVAVVNGSTFQATFDAGKAAPGAQTISGIGKDAVLVSSAGPLAILTDKGVISLGPTTPALMSDPAGYRTAAETLARQAVTRVP